MEGSEKKIPLQFVKSLWDVQLHTYRSTSDLGLKFLENFMGKCNMVVDWSAFDKGRLVVRDEKGKDFGESGCQKFRDDFVCEIEETDGLEVWEDDWWWNFGKEG